MFSCFHVTKLDESIRLNVFSPFNVHFSPHNDVVVNGPCHVHVVQVNTNGLLSFVTGFPNPVMLTFPHFGDKLVAGLYSDINIHNGGEIYFRETNDSLLLARFQSKLNPLFLPTSLFIATWDQVELIPSITGLVSWPTLYY